MGKALGNALFDKFNEQNDTSYKENNLKLSILNGIDDMARDFYSANYSKTVPRNYLQFENPLKKAQQPELGVS